ncbi:hypothetical protein DPM19_03520 [Actinomadura craniellae]|uniref:Uncharacterized protein n=1 Tax=Actinomadura craniellae TaxID=2231787 RepID=A0A365HE93_9ACTN|nr:DUF6167 family protein [Actinomadura craniellae]RAY17226.1 hypothetical protein DPM19_03520 [Actinomadura craniellae]
MKRLFWLSLGAGAGVWATHRVNRFVRSWSPEGVAARAVGAGERARAFAEDVRDEMRAREAELREAVQIDRAPPDRPRVLKARYTIIDDKDGH